MKFTILVLVTAASFVFAQSPNDSKKKYPSVFWEISGNGLKKPSYLFGTMHISSKLAFHLSDSFYVAIKNVDKVALELNPEDWQKDMFDYQEKRTGYYRYKSKSRSSSSLSIFETTFKLKDFEKEIIDVLAYEPSTVNNLLYRERQGRTDFEEDTYLDLYIYQTGRKLGKQGLGVENYRESAKIEAEGRVLEDKEKNKDKKSRMNSGNFYEELSDSYRKGDLDKLDSLEQLQMTSPAYWEKFLYERNVVQAENIDKILKNSSLFVGVGSAHLPGDRGVIELLRKKGYRLRPIFMKGRDAEQKKAIDKVKVPVEFRSHSIFDGQISCQAPGTLYELDSYLNEKKYLYSDMANGSYYLAIQFSTKSSLMHMSEQDLLDKVDKYLYEGIPGEIVEKKSIKEGEYRGFYIKNKTKKGDYQRYKIIFTPFDIFIFKIAGKQEYVNGKEGDQFMNTIKINSLYASIPSKTFTHPDGGYSLDLKYQPLLSKDKYSGESSLSYADTVQKIYTTVDHFHSFNNDYLSDSVYLILCEESFNKSDNFEKVVDRRFSKTAQGYTLEIIDSCKNNTFRSAKFILAWPHVYVLTSVGNLASLKNNYVHNSFKIQNHKVGKDEIFVDSIAQFKVVTSSPVNLDKDYVKLNQYLEDLRKDEYYVADIKNEDNSYELKDAISGNSVMVFTEKLSKYYYSSSPNYGIDTITITRGNKTPLKLESKGKLPSGYNYYHYSYGYKNSLVEAHVKYILTNEKIFVLKTYTLQGKGLSQFSKKIFDSFEPVFAQKRELTPFKLNNQSYWNDYFSANDKTFKTFQNIISDMIFQPEDLDNLYKAYKRLSPKEEKYFESKKEILNEISAVGNYRSNISFIPSEYISNAYKSYYYSNVKTTYEDGENYVMEKKDQKYFNLTHPSEKVMSQKLALLIKMYKEAGDTLNLQRSVLEAISKLKTKEAFTFVKNILIDDPLITSGRYGESLSGIFKPMSDTLELAKGLFPEIMQLSSISDDYKNEITTLINELVKHEKIKPKELKRFSSLIFEINLQYKKQRLDDEKVLIASNANTDDSRYSYYSSKKSKFTLNSRLSDLVGTAAYLYKEDEKATLLIDKMLKSPNKVLKSEIVAELLFKNKPVADSIIENLGTDEYYSYSFYNKLRIRKLTDKFPHKKVSQEQMTKIMLKNELKDYDSIVFLGRQPVSIEEKSGYVYVYKFRIKRLDDWKLVVLGIQPKDESRVNISEFINETYKKPLKDDSQMKSYVEEILHKKNITTIKSGFYNDRDSYYGSESYEYSEYDDYEE